MVLEADILAKLTPDQGEHERIQAARASLEAAATEALQKAGVEGEAKVQGSVAKDTWIAGAADMDCFLLLSTTVAETELESLVTQVAGQVLQSPRKKYAQHPYIIGERDGVQVDLVPAYRIESPDQRLSAVDRTPLHTAWVLEHLNDKDRGQVRLAKQWCKGIGAYGAETRIGGFSGYLIEVLIHHFGDLAGFLAWCRDDCTPRRIALTDDEVDDDVSPLVVVDPVDPTRNCAAAVTDATLQLILQSASAYQDAPSEQFFFPAPATTANEQTLQAHMAKQNEQWLGLVLTPKTDRLDMVFPQFQRATRVAAEALQRAGFPVKRMAATPFDDDHAVGLQWVVDAVTLPEKRTHTGPASDQEPNASRFRDKWLGHPDAVGEIAEDNGRLQVTLTIRHRTAADWLQAHFSEALTGKHVAAALADSPEVLTNPSAAPADWSAIVTEQVLDRRPWQRK